MFCLIHCEFSQKKSDVIMDKTNEGLKEYQAVLFLIMI